MRVAPDRRPRILALVDYFLPGFRGGGPTRAVANLGERLADRFELRVVTRDRDVGSRSPYALAIAGGWTPLGAAQVRYLSPAERTPWGIRNVLRATDYEVLYLNSFFSPWFSVVPLALRAAGALPKRPLVVAPRGEFAAAALAIKPRKKALHLAVARALRLCDGAVWQASSAYEEADIRRAYGQHVRVVVAPDLPAALGERDSDAAAPDIAGRAPKRAGSLSAAFLGRIVPMKNLLGAIRALAQVRGDVEFHIYGPAEDVAYWQECQREITALPEQVVVRYHGSLDPHLVPATLSAHHILFLPSLGENFGHAIHEAMAAGCPVLTSDRTPWRDLESAHAGWDVPLGDPALLTAALQRCVDMDQDSFGRYSDGARRFAHQWSGGAASVEANIALFEAALGMAMNVGAGETHV